MTEREELQRLRDVLAAIEADCNEAIACVCGDARRKFDLGMAAQAQDTLALIRAGKPAEV